MAVTVRTRLRLVDPVTQPTVGTFEVAPRLGSLHGKRIGLLDNSKLNADVVLAAVDAELRKRCDLQPAVWRRKPSASKVVDETTVRELKASCDFVVVGVGD